MKYGCFVLWVFTAALGLSSCGDSGSQDPVDTGDSASDGDTEGNSDGDSDGDTDADGDLGAAAEGEWLELELENDAAYRYVKFYGAVQGSLHVLMQRQI